MDPRLLQPGNTGLAVGALVPPLLPLAPAVSALNDAAEDELKRRASVGAAQMPNTAADRPAPGTGLAAQQLPPQPIDMPPPTPQERVQISAPNRVSGAGLNQIRQEIRQDQTPEELGQAYKRQSELVDDRAAVVADTQARAARVMQDAFTDRAGQLAASEKEIALNRQAEADSQQALDKLNYRAKYANTDKTPEEMKAYEEILKDPQADKALRANAKAELDKASRVDHGRLMDPVGNRILAALAVGLGQFSSAMNGGPNAALQIINDTIQRDIMDQQDRFARNADAALTAKDDYATLRADNRSDEEARQLSIARKYDMALQQINRIEAEGKGNLAVADAEIMREQLMAQKAEAQGNAANARRAQLMQLEAMDMQRKQGNIQLDMQRNAAIGAAQAAQMEGKVPGLPGKVIDEKKTFEVAEKKAMYDTTVENLKVLKDMISGKHPWSEAGAEALAQLNHVKVGLGKKYELGALSGEDLALIENMVGENPNAWWKDDRTRARVARMIVNTEKEADTYFRNTVRGYTPIYSDRLRTTKQK